MSCRAALRALIVLYALVGALAAPLTEVLHETIHSRLLQGRAAMATAGTDARDRDVICRGEPDTDHSALHADCTAGAPRPGGVPVAAIAPIVALSFRMQLTVSAAIGPDTVQPPSRAGPTPAARAPPSA